MAFTVNLTRGADPAEVVLEVVGEPWPLPAVLW